MSANELQDLFNKYGCDKSAKHKYDTVYQELFEPYKYESINFLEIGVFNGYSTNAFYEFFPNANIYGLDIFVRTNPDDLKILQQDRVQWVKADSTHPAVGRHLSEKFGNNIKFDIILDDGLHTPKANKQSFENLHPFLKEGGMYVVEDVWPLDRMTSVEWDHPWVRRHPERYNNLDNEMFLKAIEGSGMNIKRHDLRKLSGEPDSYIIVMT